MQEIKNKKSTLYIIVPCYNEEEQFNTTNSTLNAKLKKLIELDKISSSSKILYVNDGSYDNSLKLMKEESGKNNKVEYLSLSRNFGQQNAIISGMQQVKDYADMIITIDFDLQDDINVIDSFLQEYEKGSDVVLGVRNSRKTDTWFKRNSALAFYKIMKYLGANTEYNHAEYRLLSKKAFEAVLKYDEANIFLRGIVKDIGFKSSVVKYDRNKREYGSTHYSLKKMSELAKDGILSFSSKPLSLITKTGFIIFLLSILYLIFAVIGFLMKKNEPGWTTIICLVCLFGGGQIFCIGIIGEYIAKIYTETKKRPKYIVDETSLKKE